MLAAAHAGLTCRLCLGIHIPRALGVGVGLVLINLHVRLVTVGHWINGNIIVLNALMLGAVNHLPAMLATPLKQLPILPCPWPPQGPFRPRPPSLSLPPPSEGLGEGGEAPSVVILTPKRRAKGKFHYPTAGLFSASLKMKIKIFLLLEMV